MSQQKKPASGNDPQKKPNQTPPDDSPDTDEFLPDIDEGPAPRPVDDIQEALFEAAQADINTDVPLSDLSKPSLELDDEPDEVQKAIAEARRQAQADIDFDALPSPTLPEPKKVIRPAATKPTPPEAKTEPQPAQAPAPPPEPKPDFKPDLPEPDSVTTVSDFWLLLAIFISFRLLTLFLLRPGGFIRDWSDFDTYFGISALSDFGLYPYLDFWLEWPPLVPWLSVGAYKLSLLLPPWGDDPRLWFILILGGVFALFEVGNFVLIYKLAQRLFDSASTVTRVLWLYIGLFPPVFAMLGFFDGVALFFMLLALYFTLLDRRFLSSVTVGVGFMVKIIPILMLPVALRRLWYQYRNDNRAAGIEAGLAGVTLALTVLVLLSPFIILPALDGSPQWWTTAFNSMLGRSSWETVWAVMQGYYGFGQVAGDRLDPNAANFAIHAGWPQGMWLLVTIIFGGIYAFLFTRQANYNRSRNVVAFAGLTLAIFMLYTKGYSPQFLVYLLPFILLLMPNWRGLLYALILTGLNVLEQPIYFVMLPSETWLLVFVVVARFAMMLILAVEFGLIIWPAPERWPLLTTAQQRAPQVLGLVAALAIIVLTPLTLNAYASNRITNSSLGTLAGFMQDQASGERLIVSSQETYRLIYPYLNNAMDLKLASFDPALTERTVPGGQAPTAASLMQGLDRVWILPTGPHQNTLTNLANNRGELLGSYNFGEVGIASLYSFRPNPIPIIPEARFVGGIELVDYHLERETGAVEVTLYWRATAPQTQRLTVFTQLLNSNGELVAGASHDSEPRNGLAPVTDWAVEEVQSDPHRIVLPANLPAGEYTLAVGMYNRFNERLVAMNPQGGSFANRAMPLETLQLP